MSGDGIQKLFLLSQYLVLGAVIGGAVYHFLKQSASRDKLPPMPDYRIYTQIPGPAPESQSQNTTPKKPLLLSGFSPDQPAHLILGVPIEPSTEEVQQAYRRLMKQYHPDLVGPPGSREWHDAQSIADRLTKARDELVKRIQARKTG